MGDEHIRSFQDLIPLGPDLCPTLQVESPIVEPGLPGAAVKLDAVDDDFLTLKVNTVGQEHLAGILVTLESEVMVAGDDDHLGVGQDAQKIVELPHVIQGSAAGQIAGVD